MTKIGGGPQSENNHEDGKSRERRKHGEGTKPRHQGCMEGVLCVQGEGHEIGEHRWTGPEWAVGERQTRNQAKAAERPKSVHWS